MQPHHYGRVEELRIQIISVFGERRLVITHVHWPAGLRASSAQVHAHTCKRVQLLNPLSSIAKNREIKPMMGLFAKTNRGYGVHSKENWKACNCREPVWQGQRILIQQGIGT